MLFGCFGQSQKGKRVKEPIVFQFHENTQCRRTARENAWKQDKYFWLVDEKARIFWTTERVTWNNVFSQYEESKLLNTTITSLSIIIPRVPCVFLESKSKECNFLVCHCVKKTVHNSVCKSSTLIFIHSNNLIPVGRNLREIEGLAKVHKIQYVFLEATPTKTWREKKKRVMA